jgi:hypothetical protein
MPPKPASQLHRQIQPKIFFSEEKKQKTFILCACGKILAMASPLM